jgi:hypothetical protein
MKNPALDSYHDVLSKIKLNLSKEQTALKVPLLPDGIFFLIFKNADKKF